MGYGNNKNDSCVRQYYDTVEISGGKMADKSQHSLHPPPPPPPAIHHLSYPLAVLPREANQGYSLARNQTDKIKC